MTRRLSSVALVWRGAPETAPEDSRNYVRLRPIMEALTAAGLAVEPVLYSDETHEAVRARLRAVEGVLVWVDPISDGKDRSRLDTMLREVGTSGVWVSTHPDTIDKMGTKEVLYRTRQLGWGTDTRLYATAAEFRDRFPASLATAGPRVLKQNRSNGGLGVWKVAVVQASGTQVGRATDTLVRVQHAALRDDTTEDTTLDDFMDRCCHYFAGEGRIIDQPFVASVADGVVRAYLVGGHVVGFAQQHPSMVDAAERVIPAASVLGVPSGKAMHDADAAPYQVLRRRLETEWVPGLCRLVELPPSDLPLLWDADFFVSVPLDDAEPGYLLCEINVSSVLPFPSQAPQALADLIRRRAQYEN